MNTKIPIFLVKIILGVIFTKFIKPRSTVLLGCPTNDEGADFKLSPSWEDRGERGIAHAALKKNGKKTGN